jgi:hypothetical protein
MYLAEIAGFPIFRQRIISYVQINALLIKPNDLARAFANDMIFG